MTKIAKRLNWASSGIPKGIHTLMKKLCQKIKMANQAYLFQKRVETEIVRLFEEVEY